MSSQTITTETVSQLVASGVINTAHVVRDKRGWLIFLTQDEIERPLAARKGKARVFRHLKRILSYLRGVGILHFDVDATRSARTSKFARVHSSHVKQRVDRYDEWFLLMLGVIAEQPALERPHLPE